MFKARVIIREEQRKSNMYHGVREGIIRPCRVLNRVIQMRRTDRPIGEVNQQRRKGLFLQPDL